MLAVSINKSLEIFKICFSYVIPNTIFKKKLICLFKLRNPKYLFPVSEIQNKKSIILILTNHHQYFQYLI